MSLFSVWKESIKHRKRDKWLIQEYPKIALEEFEGLREINPSLTSEELYVTIIKDFALAVGVPIANHAGYTESILEAARSIEPVEPFGLRMIVVSLICSRWSLRSELAIATAISSVSDVIPEHL